MAPLSEAAAKARFQQAVKLGEAGKYAEAERLYRDLVRTNPNVAAAWANLGLLRLRASDNAQGTAYLEKAVVLSPKTAAYSQLLASAYLQNRQFDAAARTARSALALEPKHAATRETLGYALVGQKKFADAVPYLREAVASGKTRKSPEADRRNLALLVFSLNSSGQKDEALKVARQYVGYYPSDPSAQLLRGDMAAQAGLRDEAFQAYSEAAALVPQNTQLIANLRFLARERGRTRELADTLARAASQKPDSAALQFLVGTLYSEDPTLSERERAVKSEPYFRRAVLANPKNPDYLAQLGLALYVTDDASKTAESRRLFENALALNPKHVPARMGIGYLAERRQAWDEAAGAYRAVLAQQPKEYAARRRLAGILFAVGATDPPKRDAAYREMETLANQYPTDTVALAELATWYITGRRLGDAERTYQRALQRAPKDARLHVGIGQLHERMGVYAQAKTDYENALAADPNDPTAYFSLSTMLARSMKYAEAAAIMEQRVRLAPDDNAARWQLSQHYQELKRDDDALREMRALKPAPNDRSRVAYRLGPANLLSSRERHAEALVELDAVAKEYPNETSIAYSRANSLEKLGRFDEAENVLKSIQTQVGESDTKPQLALAAMRERQNRPEDAATIYEAILRKRPLEPNVRLSLLKVRKSQNQPEAAYEFLAKLGMENAEKPNLEALVAAGDLYETQGRKDDALALIERASAKYPTSVETVRLYAQMLLVRAQTDPEREKTAAALEKVTALDPKDAVSRYHIGLMRELQKRPVEALAAYRDALRVDPNHQPSQAAVKRLEKAQAPAAPGVKESSKPAP